MDPIRAISAPTLAPTPKPFQPAGAPGAFQELFASSIQGVEQARGESRAATEQFLSGQTDDIHKAAIATQRAELSTELFLQVRNKVVSAYQEIMRMQM